MRLKRLTRSGTYEERRLLGAARNDGPDASLRNRVMLSVGVGAALVASTTPTAGASVATHAGSGAMAKWFGIAGVVIVGSVVPAIAGDSNHMAHAASHVAVRLQHADATQLVVAKREPAYLESAHLEPARLEADRLLEAAQALPPRAGDALVRAPRDVQSRANAMRRPLRGSLHSDTNAPRLDVAEEVRLVDAARAAMRAGNAQHCLELLTERQRRFPDGVLVPEAAMLRVLALRQSGQIVAAQREGQRFLLAHSSGPLATNVRSVLSAIESENSEQADVD